MLKKFKIVLFLFLLLVFVLDVTTAYSKYTSEAIGEVKTNIAKWQILVNDNDITSNYTSTIDFTPVIEENVNVAANTMAPQSKGYFDIEINPENVGTSFTYTIELLPLENSDITDIVITDYATIDENTDLNNITKKSYNNRRAFRKCSNGVGSGLPAAALSIVMPPRYVSRRLINNSVSNFHP